MPDLKLRLKLIKNQQEEIGKKISENDEFIRLFEKENELLLNQWIEKQKQIHNLKHK